jgi:hypothetical protein
MSPATESCKPHRPLQHIFTAHSSLIHMLMRFIKPSVRSLKSFPLHSFPWQSQRPSDSDLSPQTKDVVSPLPPPSSSARHCHHALRVPQARSLCHRRFQWYPPMEPCFAEPPDNSTKNKDNNSDDSKSRPADTDTDRPSHSSEFESVSRNDLGGGIQGLRLGLCWGQGGYRVFHHRISTSQTSVSGHREGSVSESAGE